MLNRIATTFVQVALWAVNLYCLWEIIRYEKGE